MKQKPIVFNQDGPGWSCKNTLKVGMLMIIIIILMVMMMMMRLIISWLQRWWWYNENWHGYTLTHLPNLPYIPISSTSRWV
jgi:hypothetical protein